MHRTPQEKAALVRNYFEWHHAIYNYYFGSENDNVILYATPDIINEIGLQIRSDGSFNYKHFVESVCFDKDAAQDFLYYKYQERGIRISDGMLSMAVLLTKPKYEVSENVLNNQRPITVPFLNYIILAISIASQSGDANEKGVRDALKKVFPNNSISKLETLLDALSKKESRFMDGRLNAYRYVGRIRYQLIMTPSQEKSLKQTLYRFDFPITPFTPYGVIYQRLYNFVTDDIKALLDLSLKDEAYRRRIEDEVRLFDRDQYQLDQNDNVPNTQTYSFLNAIKIDYQSAEVVPFTNWRPDNDIQGSIRIKGKDATIGIYESKYRHEEFDALLLNPTPLKWPGYDLDSSIEAKIGSGKLCPVKYYKDVIFFGFKEIEDVQYYIETLDLTGHSNYIIAVRKNDKSDKMIEWLRNNTVKLESLNGALISGVDPGVWDLFFAEKVTSTYQGRVQNSGRNKVYVELLGGIQLPKTRNVYLATALPYFAVPSNRAEIAVKSLVIDGIERKKETDYRQIRVDEKLIIDLSNPYIVGDKTLKCEVELTNGDKFTFYISHPTTDLQADRFYKIDKWGQTFKPGTISENVATISGNSIPGNVHINGIWPNPYDFVKWEDNEIVDNYYFLNLLTSCCLMSENYSINKKDLEKCARYAATRKGMMISDNLVKNTQYALVNNGYLCRNYQGITTFQFIPPAFITIPQVFNDNTRHVLLSGCVSRPLLADLLRYTSEKNLSLGYMRGNETESLIPQPLVVRGNFDPNDFINRFPSHLCEYANEDLAARFIHFSGKVDEYQQQIGEPINCPGELEDCNIPTFPRIRKSVLSNYRGQQTQYLEIEEGHIHRPETDVWDWMSVYCANCQGSPKYITTASSILVPEKSVLPSLVRRALHLKNMGDPQWKNVLICNNIVSKDVLFTRVREYQAEANSNIGRRFSDVLGNDSIFKGQKIASAVSRISSELWIKKTSRRAFNSSSEPNFLVHLTIDLTIGKKDYYASKEWVAVKNNGQYAKLDLGQDSINTLLSKILLPAASTTVQDADVTLTDVMVNIPSQDQYNIHELMIIR